MEFITNFFWPPTFSIPSPISVPDLLSPSPSLETHQQLIHQLTTHQFAILRPSSEGKEAVLLARKKAEEFFDLPYEEKLKEELPPIKGEIFDIKRNRGYMTSGGSQKEYYKMRVIDTKENYPENPQGLADAYIAGINYMHRVVRAALNCVAKGERKAGEEKGEEKLEEEGRWISKQTLHNIEPFLEKGSSVSTVRYFDQTKPRWQEINGQEEKEKDTEKKEKEKEKVENPYQEKQEIDEADVDDNDHIALRAHYDTGVFTLILIGETPGLQLWCPNTKQWLEMEKIGELHDLVLIMGKKIKIITNKGVPLEPTYHRVCIDQSVRRHSILFFYDLLTKNED